MTDPGPDGHLWQLWDYEDSITLQRDCDAEGCEKGLLHTPARNCGRCGGSGYLTRSFTVEPPPKPEPTDFQCNGDYWYKSGCGNRVDSEGCYCENCTKILRDNEGLWPGQEDR